MQQKKQRLSRRSRVVQVVLILLLISAIALSLTSGRYAISFQDLLAAVTGQSGVNAQVSTVLWHIRLPRIVAAVLVGACLSAAGAAYQGVFQNPMASPDILGSSAGATFGAALAILLGMNDVMIAGLAFCFSLLTVSFVYFISAYCKGKQVLTLILTGVMMSTLFSAGTSFIKLVADPSNALPAITYWTMGSLAAVELSDLKGVIVPMGIGLSILLAIRWHMNMLTLGDEQAMTMGIPVKKLRVVVVLAATLMTASSVAISGMIGWVGLVIPHLARKLVGNDYRDLMPTAMLIGALFLLIVDNVSRNAFVTEVPIGILTAFIGAPFLIYLIVGREVFT